MTRTEEGKGRGKKGLGLGPSCPFYLFRSGKTPLSVLSSWGFVGEGKIRFRSCGLPPVPPSNCPTLGGGLVKSGLKNPPLPHRLQGSDHRRVLRDPVLSVVFKTLVVQNPSVLRRLNDLKLPESTRRRVVGVCWTFVSDFTIQTPYPSHLPLRRSFSLDSLRGSFLLPSCHPCTHDLPGSRGLVPGTCRPDRRRCPQVQIRVEGTPEPVR